MNKETPLRALLSLLTTSIETIESELEAAQMPTFTLEPQWHPLDSSDAVPSARLHEARKVAMGSANMIKALVQDVGTALFDLSTGALDTSAWILTAQINLLDVFRTDEERKSGLHVDEMVARLPEDKKVNPEKLGRSLRFLSTEHMWTEPSPYTFAPTRWALLNQPGTVTWAMHDPVLWGTMVGCISLTENMVTPDTKDSEDVERAPFVTAWHNIGNTQDQTWWKWFEREPERQARFAQSMAGVGMINMAPIQVDYPWESVPPNTTLVDVGGGQGSVSMHVLRHVYDKVPTLKAVVQDYHTGPLETGKKYWAKELPEALRDGRVEFEVHDFFNENPRQGPSLIYWMRFIMHDWADSYAIRILQKLRASCHPTSKVLLADCIIREALPTKPSDVSFEESLKAIDNKQPLAAPYPLPGNFGVAHKASNTLGMITWNNINGFERTLSEHERIISASGFKLNKIYYTRGQAGILELLPA
ncbi:S-adenosyl-L-methionine-dependent methyltransferase [Daedaleopsis nitida]|nr:S-adenosyl-L-methionine-dependent methyltransferase [Daedaleopsis nitida]